jgi:type I restriction enzyme S subunit
MRSNYKRLGDYIKEVDLRNTKGELSTLLGINIDKYYMPSVANIVGTDLTAYKIVKRNQFACNRMHVGRDKRLPIALSKINDDFIVSPAYEVFEIINENSLLPEYLMMWFSRKEFDRNAWFYTDADVRGGLNWKDFCNMQLPVPNPYKQREIVKEYNIIVNRIALNNQLIKKLEETAQKIYKQWFVDFEFPNEDGKPYKSNGGEMVESELGDIPKEWRKGSLNELVDVIDGDRGANYPSGEELTKVGHCLFLNAGNITKDGFSLLEKSVI